MMRSTFSMRGRRVVPHRDVERLGRDVLLGPVRDRSFDPAAIGSTMDGMKQLGLGGVGQLVGEHLRLFGNDVEPEDLDRDQPIAGRLVGAENRTECANANLMQDPEGPERRRRRECGRIVSGQ